ncbi:MULTISPECIES: 16S rRNA (uracil(1498)-N(3))-methyltransferase [unclassified Bartonella]|uniref:16S rRNA (uracil(1498)-N(3))-methyltransferase n=1 Tax=unclassified Bartonella TaxID=2645622 RepID=UPI00099AEE68|nr:MULTISPECIES: 16S rRNA (uracil(1498)-N(3))-methyltransferase [unclassified Bartonella]AQX22474.1 16S rRNA (uracil1498-N3)-methyltransferase [Bartonella sp. 11B]AQX24244.1 16S rRNA (uracil1498-N3)-methyltransferase [Bartonella sp. 114]AQX24922.1 16S rRNA (uracil1498-N3)-methyltransferase [Bartonella sp. Coyote22sub2]
MRANYKLKRLFVRQLLALNEEIVIEGQQASYLIHVLRMKEGAEILLFNGQDGEWLAKLLFIKKKIVVARLIRQERLQPIHSDLFYCFAPLKHMRLDYVIQKAVEMGVSVLYPVITHHTQVTRINMARIEANIIEASEQCGILSLPKCAPAVSLETFLENWDKTHALFFCDELNESYNPIPLLRKHGTKPLGVLIGPEGGFSEEERVFLKKYPFVFSVSLGPRILRADTAAVAALTLVNATMGDWSIGQETCNIIQNNSLK